MVSQKKGRIGDEPVERPGSVYSMSRKFEVSFLLPSSSFPRALELPRTPARTAPTANEARASPNSLLELPFILCSPLVDVWHIDGYGILMFHKRYIHIPKSL